MIPNKFKMGDMVRLNKDADIDNISHNKDYIVLQEPLYINYILLEGDDGNIKLCYSEVFHKVDNSDYLKPLLFITISKTTPQQSIKEIYHNFKGAFPNHKIVLVSEYISEIVEKVKDSSKTLYKKEEHFVPLPQAPQSPHPSEPGPWWEHMPITVTSTGVVPGQITIFDYGVK
jgi:hypothetical protein